LQKLRKIYTIFEAFVKSLSVHEYKVKNVEYVIIWGDIIKFKELRGSAFWMEQVILAEKIERGECA